MQKFRHMPQLWFHFSQIHKTACVLIFQAEHLPSKSTLIQHIILNEQRFHINIPQFSLRTSLSCITLKKSLPRVCSSSSTREWKAGKNSSCSFSLKIILGKQTKQHEPHFYFPFNFACCTSTSLHQGAQLSLKTSAAPCQHNTSAAVLYCTCRCHSSLVGCAFVEWRRLQ